MWRSCHFSSSHNIASCIGVCFSFCGYVAEGYVFSYYSILTGPNIPMG